MIPLLRSSKAITLCCALFSLSVLAGGAQLSAQTAAPATPAATPAAAVPSTSFDAVTAHLDRGGSLYLYLSAADWLSTLSQEVIQYRDLVFSPQAAQTPADREKIAREFDLAAALIKQSGLEQITGLGASSIAIEPSGYRNTLFVHHAPGQETGFLGSLFGSAPHALTTLDLLPADTAAASFCDYDIPRLFNTVRETLAQCGIPEVQKSLADGLAQFAQVTGLSLDDFLQSLGGTSGIIVTLDPEKKVELPSQTAPKQVIPFPRLAILIATKNDRIYQRIEQLTGMLPMLQRTEEPDLRMFSMAYPVSPQFTVRPTVAQWGNFLVLASDDQLVRAIMATQKSGQGFKASPAFAELAAGLPAEGNGFSLATTGFMETFRNLQAGMLSPQGATADSSGPAGLMRKMFAAQKTGPTYTVWSHVADGWLNVGKAPQSLSSAALPLLFVPAALAAGTAWPFYRAHQPSVQTTH